MFKKCILYILFNTAILCGAEIDFFGHFGIQGLTNFDNNKKDYIGASATLGIDVLFDNGIAVGTGGWVAIPVYESVKKNTDDIYKNVFVLSDLYFSYFNDTLQLIFGRYDTNELGYEWFNGNNEGLSLGYIIDNFMRIWGLYSYEQAFQFRKNKRKLYGQIGSLWNFQKHKNIAINKKGEHLVSFGVDLYYESMFMFRPYLYYITNNLIASGASIRLFFGNSDDLYSSTILNYTYIDEVAPSNGHLMLFDQEFGYDWFSMGAGYYKTINNGIGGLSKFGDNSRFYGGVIFATSSNLAQGSYFSNNQSTWYIFMGVKHSIVNIDLLYADGDYKEISALASLTLFEHLEFGGGYINLGKFENKRRDAAIGFVKAIW